MLRSVFVALSAPFVAGRQNERVNTQITTMLWELIVRDQGKSGSLSRLTELLSSDNTYAGLRSEDGRGAVFWAMEAGNMPALALVKELNDGAYEAQMKDADDSGWKF
jgi:hypothetical protein